MDGGSTGRRSAEAASSKVEASQLPEENVEYQKSEQTARNCILQLRPKAVSPNQYPQARVCKSRAQGRLTLQDSDNSTSSLSMKKRETGKLTSGARSTRPSTFGLLNDRQLIGDLAAVFGDARHQADRLLCLTSRRDVGHAGQALALPLSQCVAKPDRGFFLPARAKPDKL